MMLPFSTRTRRTMEQGLAAGLEELLPLVPPALVIEAGAAAGPLGPVVALTRHAGVPVLAVVGPLLEGESPAADDLASGVATTLGNALDAFRRTLAVMGRLRSRRLVVPIGAAGLPGADLLEEELRGGVEDAPAAVAAWKEKVRGAREAAVDRLCRATHALASQESGVDLLLLPTDSPAGLLDPETAEWILEDVPRRNLGLAIDVGAAELARLRGGVGFSRWLEPLDAHVRLLCLTDHDGAGRSDLLPGAGRLDPGELRPFLARSRPAVVRLDPTRGSEDLVECEALLRDRLGGLPDPAAWL